MFAEKYFGSPQKALGHMMGTGSSRDKKDIRIVGVVANYVHRAVRDKPDFTMYTPAAQDQKPGGMWVYVRSWSAPATVMGEIRQAVQQIDSKLVVASLESEDAMINDNINQDRTITLLAVSFGVLAMLLAAVGLYGVLAYATAQRTREIGVRMALGADRSGVMALVVRDVLKLAGVSVAVAVPVALLATRFLRAQLFGVSGMDPVVLTCVVTLVLLVALVAAALPARRAARVEPMVALRTE
jgi:ABC-type antimicrobial peptide transport system permease subunit